MKKSIVRYCYRCECETEHRLIETKRLFEGASRVFLGIVTLGISETANEIAIEGKYKCTECGNIKTV